MESFRKKYDYNPEWGAEAGYMEIACWARMVSEAGTFNPIDVIKTYEKGEHFDSLVGDVWFRPQDHQLVTTIRGHAGHQGAIGKFGHGRLPQYPIGTVEFGRHVSEERWWRSVGPARMEVGLPPPTVV